MRRVLVLSSLLLLFLLASVSAVTRSNSDCSSCHYSESGSAGYEYVPPGVLLSVPMFVEPGGTFDVTVTVLFSEYDLKNLDIELFAEPELFDFDRTTVQEVYPLRGADFIFTGRAGSEGTAEIRIVVTAGVHYDHHHGSGDDFREETIEKKAVVNVGSTSLAPSAWSIVLDEDGSELELLASGEVGSVTVYAPPGLSVRPNGIERMGPGDSLRITVTPDGGYVVDGNIIISWRENGTPYSIPVAVIYAPDAGGSSTVDHLAGRIAGLATIIVLAASLILGGLWNTRGYLNRKIKARTRVRAHCGVSWFLVALSLYHGLVLMLGAYSNQLGNGWIVAGYISMLAMLIAALSGGFQRSITRLIGARGWRYLHLYSTLGALGLGMLHGVRIGTDLAFIRESSFLSNLVPVILIIIVLTAAMVRPQKKKGKKNTDDGVSRGHAVDGPDHSDEGPHGNQGADMTYMRLQGEDVSERDDPGVIYKDSIRSLQSEAMGMGMGDEGWKTRMKEPDARDVDRYIDMFSVVGKEEEGIDNEREPCESVDRESPIMDGDRRSTGPGTVRKAKVVRRLMKNHIFSENAESPTPHLSLRDERPAVARTLDRDI